MIAMTVRHLSADFSFLDVNELSLRSPQNDSSTILPETSYTGTRSNLNDSSVFDFQTSVHQAESDINTELIRPKAYIIDIGEQDVNESQQLIEAFMLQKGDSNVTCKCVIATASPPLEVSKQQSEQTQISRRVPIDEETVWKKVVHVFTWVAKVCYILCPPVPNMVIRKAAFHPPKHCHYYFLIGGEKNKRQQFSNAKSAQKSSNLTLCLPHLLQAKFRNSDVADQLLRVQVHLIPSTNGDILVALFIRCEKSYRRRRPSPYLILFAQPNSSDIGSCMLTDPNLVDIADFLQCDLMAFDYSGFGLSTGTPSEKTVYQNMESVYQYLIKKLNAQPDEIILIGFSMGTAAAIHLASSEKVAGLVLIAPFTSLLRVLGGRPSSDRTCCLDQFSSFDKAPKVNCRTLICHGMNDVIVSMNHGAVLQSRLPNATDPFFLDKATHQGIYCERKMWDRVQQFLFSELGVTAKWKAPIITKRIFVDYDF